MRKRRTILQEFDRWAADEMGWAPLTRHAYRTAARMADEWLATHRGVALPWANTKDLKAWLFSTTPHARSRNNRRQALIGFGRFLVDKGYTEDNAALGLTRVPEPEPLPQALDPEHARGVVRVSRTLPLMERSLMMTLIYAALRRSEARLLERRNLEPGGEWLRITGKRRKERMIPAHQELRETLLAWFLLCPDPRWVFPSPRRAGYPISTAMLRRIVREVGERAGVPGLRPHQLRHTTATELLAKTGDLRVVQEFLGHANPRTTTVYAKVRPANLQEAANRLEF